MATVEKELPSWMCTSDSDDESTADKLQLKEDHKELRQLQTAVQNNKVESSKMIDVDVDVDDEDDDDDDDDEVNRPSILPANLQVRESQTPTSTTKRGVGLFRLGRRNDTGSVTTDHPQTENEESGSVASYVKGFSSGNTIFSSATSSSVFSVLSRMMTFGFNKKASNDDAARNSSTKHETEPSPFLPPLHPKKTKLAPSRKDTVKKPQRRAPTQKQSTSSVQDQLPEAIHSAISPDPTPTHKSISTMDTEECTFEGGIPSVIYCFMKVNPHEQDENVDDDDWNASGGLRSFLPSAIAKRLPKRKQPKTFIDEDDEESYFQTLVML